MNFVEIKTLDGEFRIINLDHIVSIKSICKGNGTCFTDVNGSTYHADVPYRIVADDLCGNDDDNDDSDDDDDDDTPPTGGDRTIAAEFLRFLRG